jgi:branched-chain amino acid transport system permease protein
MEELLQHIINGLSLGAIYALIALGYTMVYGILQFINFAHSDIYMIGAFASYYGVRFFGLEGQQGFLPFVFILLFAMTVCSLMSFSIEKLAYRPLRKAPKINILITAIGVSLLLEYSGQVIFGADPKVFPPLLPETVLMNIGPIQVMSLDAIILLVSIGMMMALHYMVYHTKMGKAMRAVSQNATVAAMMGINIDKVISFTFILGSALAGVASVLVGMRYPKIEPLMGMLMGTKAFVAAVLGGIGSLPGAVLGGLIMGLSEEMVVGYLASTYKDALSFGILIFILVFRPAGILGSLKIEKV